MTVVVETAESAGLSELERTVQMNYVTPGWFASYGIPIREGRDFAFGDTKDTPAVVIVSEAFARRFLAAGSAVNATVTDVSSAQSGGSAARKTVVAIAGDTVYRTVRDDMLPTMYAPLDQLRGWMPNFDISVRSSGPSPIGLQNAVSRALKSAAPELTFSFVPLAQQLDASFMQERLVAILSSFFGVLALLLAALGLYGVTAYSVARRRREIGIRMALGSAPAGVVRLVLWRIALLVIIGVAIGSGVCLWASRFVASLLYGVEPRDLSTLAGAIVMLAAVAGIAAFVPAWSASRIDPALVLRAE
jgi:ABC-type antimicrobial peptide transport system permease subunit